MRRRSLTFPFFRSIVAHMRERYIFNFRLRPADLARRLPVPWLEPQVVDGWSVLSFCILWLERLTVSPFPPVLRFDALSCAYRIGVIDRSGPQPAPAVYVTDRYVDLPAASLLGPVLLHDAIPVVKAAIGHHDGITDVQVSFLDGLHLFSAEVMSATGFSSKIFPDVLSFAAFIKSGVSSYTPSIYRDKYAKVDLEKEDVAYTPLDAKIEFSLLGREWAEAGLEFDSAVMATGARYKWTYRGLWSSGS